MVYEVTVHTVDPTQRDDYVEVYRNAWQASNPPGFRGGRVLRCVEDPAQVIFILAWESIEAHEENRRRPEHAGFRQATLPLRVAPSHSAHYSMEEL